MSKELYSEDRRIWGEERNVMEDMLVVKVPDSLQHASKDLVGGEVREYRMVLTGWMMFKEEFPEIQITIPVDGGRKVGKEGSGPKGAFKRTGKKKVFGRFRG